MTDKEKIKSEIERLLRVKEETSHLNQSDFNSGRWKGLMEVKSFIDSLPKESASEDLEEAAKEYRLSASLDNERYLTFGSNIMNAFVAGANWQKEQMMKDAIDAKLSFGQPVLLSHPVSPQIAKDGDKIKLIVVKEG